MSPLPFHRPESAPPDMKSPGVKTPETRSPALAWLGHPLTVTAVVVLLLNDHLLKPLWPGALSGKLSDVAGLIVAPPLLDLLVRRPRLSILVTGVAFTLVKTTAVGAALASQAWTLVWGPSRVLADPVDLVALPALYAAWWAWRHPDARAVRLARAAIVVPLTVLAVAATGQVDTFTPYSAYAVDVIDGTIVVATRGGSQSWLTGTGFASGDAGESWSGRTVPETLPERTSACVPGLPDRCYRIVPGRLKVEESRDGRWVTAWEVSPDDQAWLARAYDPEYPDGTGVVASLGIAVQKLPGGHVVVVANGADGIALRDVSGAWHRLGWVEGKGFASTAAPSLTSPGRYEDSIHTIALSAAFAAGVVALGCGVRRFGFFVAALALWAGVSSFRSGMDTAILFNPFSVLLGIALMSAGAGGMIMSAVRGEAPLRTWVIGAATAVVTYYAIMTPFRAWSAGWLDSSSSAFNLSTVLGIATVCAGVLTVIRLGGPRRNPR